MIPRPTRTPTEQWRVQWSRLHWARDANGRPRWKSKWFARHADAVRLVQVLEDDNAEVILDRFELTHVYRRPSRSELGLDGRPME